MPRKKTEKPQDTIKFYNKYNRHLYNSAGSRSELPSLTQQGQGISMAEMIRKFSRGDIPPLAQSAFHGHDVDMDKFTGSKPIGDLSEVSQLLKEEKASREEKKELAELRTSEAEKKEAKPTEGTSEAMKATESESAAEAPKEA